MDNAQRGGANVLEAVFKVVTDKEFVKSSMEKQEIRVTPEADLQKSVGRVLQSRS
jgi:hypothetical protein